MTDENPMDKMKTTGIDFMPQFSSTEEKQLYKKQRLIGAFRLFGQLGFDEGAAGHITLRDPIDPDTFWVNGVGISFKKLKMCNLIRVNKDGEIVEGEGFLNMAAFVIHSAIHETHPYLSLAVERGGAGVSL